MQRMDTRLKKLNGSLRICGIHVAKSPRQLLAQRSNLLNFACFSQSLGVVLRDVVAVRRVCAHIP
jgi:hypothetical protein